MSLVPSNGAEEYAVELLAKAERQAAEAKAKLEAFAKNLPSADVFRSALVAVAMDKVVGILTKQYEDRTANEAAKTATMVMELAAGYDLLQLNQSMAGMTGDDRRELMAEFKKKAREKSL